jgi:hypothetical protein
MGFNWRTCLALGKTCLFSIAYILSKNLSDEENGIIFALNTCRTTITLLFSKFVVLSPFDKKDMTVQRQRVVTVSKYWV